MDKENQKKRGSKKEDMKEILKKITEAYLCEEESNKVFTQNKQMIYSCSLTADDIAMLKNSGKSVFSIPVILPQLNHQLKNIQDSVPSAEVEALAPEYEPFCEFLTEKVNHILEKNYYQNVLSRVAEDAMSGGKGIFELKTEYLHNLSLDQKVVLKAVEDPTQIYFDPCSKLPSKEDSMFCYKIIELDKRTFRKLFPKINLDEMMNKMKNDDKKYRGRKI